MGRSAAPELTVRYSGSAHTFVAGNDVVIGRDIHADLRIPDPLISRAHLVLRFDEGRWVAIDNDSLNGMFVEGRRVPAVDVEDGQNINIGSLVGPLLTFEVDQNSVGGPRTSEVSSAPRPASAEPTDVGPAPRRNSGERSNIATSIRKIHWSGKSAAEAPSGSLTIGRTTDNDIVIADMLASRHHATLVPTAAGTEIHDAHSINGTFVNGARVDQALLHEGDMVTIGNVDLVFRDGTLVRRTETEAATRTGGLDVHGVTWTIEGNKTLLNNISFAARPGTLTAVIGPSGAGKSTLARLVAGYTHPTDGHGVVRGPRHPRRVRLAAQPDRDGAPGRRRARPAHRQPGADVSPPSCGCRPTPPRTTANRSSRRCSRNSRLTQHADTRVDKLSGGQRKRASVALELLTGPSLLILDEPTSGLDPALDRQVMTMLRQLADAGRVVLVVTHSLTYLDVCDQVLLLAPGGKTAFCGPPSQIGPSMGTTNWADIFSAVAPTPTRPTCDFLQHGHSRHRHRGTARSPRTWASPRIPACGASSRRSRAARCG